MDKKTFSKQVKLLESRCLANKNQRSSNENFDFFESIDSTLKKLCENGVSFPKMKKEIDDIFAKKISISTLKRFCVEKGYYVPKSKKNKKV